MQSPKDLSAAAAPLASNFDNTDRFSLISSQMTANHQRLIVAKLGLLILLSWAGLTQISQPAFAWEQPSIEDVIDQPTDEDSQYNVGVDISPGKTVASPDAKRSTLAGFKWHLRAENIRIIILASEANFEFIHNAMGSILLRNIVAHCQNRAEIIPHN